MAEEAATDASRVARYGAVVLLDALGIKKVLARDEPGPVLATWREAVELFHEAAAKARAVREACRDCRVYAFSDTIIMTVQGRSPETPETPEDIVAVYEEVTKLIGPLLRQPFARALYRGLLLRGVITIGRFYESEPASSEAGAPPAIVIGPAIDEAAEWYELAEWIGVVCSPTTGMVLDRIDQRGESLVEAFIKHDVPMKSRTKERLPDEKRWALAWPHAARKLAAEDGRGDERQRLLAVFAARPIGVGEAPKYKHTIEFLDAVPRLQNTSL